MVWGPFDTLLAHVHHHTGFGERVPDGRNAVLMYHSIGEPAHYGNLSTDRLARDLRYLTNRYRIVDLPAIFESGSRKLVALTFDDGYRNFYEKVLPMLREFDVPATVFVTTGLIERGEHRLSRSKWIADEFPSGSVMTERQIERLAESELVTVGNHTRTHPNLRGVETQSDLNDEILGAKERLESEFGISIDRFAYPFGDFDQRSLSLVQRSHEFAVTVESGLVDETTDEHRIPRIAAHHPERRVRWNLVDSKWGPFRVR